MSTTIKAKCSSCLRSFGPINTDKEPRVLPCGHNYCKLCVSDLLERGEAFNCKGGVR